MKVLLIGDYPPPLGGVAVHVKQLHDFLVGQGVEAKVLDIGKGGRQVPDVIPARSLRQLASRLAQFSSAGWTLHLHSSGNNPKAWAVAAVVAAAAKPFGSPALLTVHSGLFPAFVERSVLNRALVRTTLPGFSQVVAVSAGVRDALQRCGASESKLALQPAFLASQVKPGQVPEGFDRARQRRAPLLAMAHHPSPVYGRELMFQALKSASEHYPDIGLAVFGPGTDAAEFEESAKRAGVRGLIENFGALDHAEALAVIAGCDAFIRPTTADGDSVSVRESLALGVPCIASAVCPRPEGTFTFPAGDASGLLGALARALATAGSGARAQPDAGPVMINLYQKLQRPRAGPQLAPALH